MSAVEDSSQHMSWSELTTNQLRTDVKGKKVAHTRLPSVGFRSWSWFLAVSLQEKWDINPAVGCNYFPPGLQLPPQPLRWLLPILLFDEQRHNGCDQFAYDCYPTASRLRFEPRPCCAWVQHSNHSATEPPRTGVFRWKCTHLKSTNLTDLNWPDLNWPAKSRPSYTMRSLVTRVSVTTWSAAAKLERLVLG